MANEPKTLFGHPRGLYVLFFTELWERFSFYGMRALLLLYMLNHFLWSQEEASEVLKWYFFLAYALPVLGGLLADKLLGAKRTVILGCVLLSIGHFLMAFEPLPFFYTALGFIVLGVGCLKPNISTQVGNLYPPDDPRRDGAFTIFYMGINLGAFLGPIICGWLRIHYGFHYGFAAAGVGMIFGLIVYVMGHRKLVEFQQHTNDEASESSIATTPKAQAEHPPHVVRDRVIVLLVVFAFVILFWMAFEQSANVMVVWADKHTNLQPFSSEPLPVSVEAVSQSGNTATGWRHWEIGADQTQSINPFFIIAFAPLVAGFWMWLQRRKLQPSTPTKMVFGIALVAVAFLAMLPAATQENGSSSASLEQLPKGLDFSEYGATRLAYDAQSQTLRMNGVLTDLDRIKLLAETAPTDFVTAVDSLAKKAEKKRSQASRNEEWQVTEILASAPAGLRIVGVEAEKVFQWNPDTKTLAATGEIKKRARVELLAMAAPVDFKQAVDKVYLDSSEFRISIWWLVLHLFLITMGELCLSPVGLSLVTKIAPAKYMGLFMGGWFLATAVAEYLAHFIGGMWGTMTPARYFTIFIIACGIGALLMAILIRPLKRMMHGVH